MIKFIEFFTLFAGASMLFNMLGWLNYLKSRPIGIEFIVGGLCAMGVYYLVEYSDKREGKKEDE